MSQSLLWVWFLAGPGHFALAVADPSREDIAAELARVFARPEFQGESTDRAWIRWLLQSLFAFFSWLGELHAVSPVLFWIFLVGSILVLVLLLGHIGWTLYSAFYVAGRQRTTVSAQVAEQRRLSARFRAEAEARAAERDYTAAIRLLFLSLVYAFEESGTLHLQRALTNREYLRTVADRPELAEGLSVFVDLLDRNWYGQLPSNEEQYAYCAELYDSLRRRG